MFFIISSYFLEHNSYCMFINTSILGFPYIFFRLYFYTVNILQNFFSFVVINFSLNTVFFPISRVKYLRYFANCLPQILWKELFIACVFYSSSPVRDRSLSITIIITLHISTSDRSIQQLNKWPLNLKMCTCFLYFIIRNFHPTQHPCSTLQYTSFCF